jgi:hypothetical protein
MTDIVQQLRQRDGDWLCEKAADEIERLRALVLDGCAVFAAYDLPEHAFHYRRLLEKEQQEPR